MQLTRDAARRVCAGIAPARAESLFQPRHPRLPWRSIPHPMPTPAPSLYPAFSRAVVISLVPHSADNIRLTRAASVASATSPKSELYMRAALSLALLSAAPLCARARVLGDDSYRRDASLPVCAWERAIYYETECRSRSLVHPLYLELIQFRSSSGRQGTASALSPISLSLSRFSPITVFPCPFTLTVLSAAVSQTLKSFLGN